MNAPGTGVSPQLRSYLRTQLVFGHIVHRIFRYISKYRPIDIWIHRIPSTEELLYLPDQLPVFWISYIEIFDISKYRIPKGSIRGFTYIGSFDISKCRMSKVSIYRNIDISISIQIYRVERVSHSRPPFFFTQNTERKLWWASTTETVRRYRSVFFVLVFNGIVDTRIIRKDETAHVEAGNTLNRPIKQALLYTWYTAVGMYYAGGTCER